MYLGFFSKPSGYPEKGHFSAKKLKYAFFAQILISYFIPIKIIGLNLYCSHGLPQIPTYVRTLICYTEYCKILWNQY